MTNFFFNATCEPTDLRTCQTGDKFLNPCDCKKYYQCTNDYSMSNMSCTTGTLWDYKFGYCDHDKKIEINQNCSLDNSWTRCNTTASRHEYLRFLCTGTTTITPNITAKPPEGEPATETKVNPGMVAGLILAGAVITLAAIALFVLYSRRKKAKEQKMKRRTTAENREYFQGDPTEDPYAIIDERMISPVYNQSDNNNIIRGSMNGTMTTVTTTLPSDENMAEYDNSAFREQENGYTASLKREQETPRSPYDTLSASAKSYEKPVNKRDSELNVIDDDIVESSGSQRSSTENGNVQNAVSVDTSDLTALNNDDSDDKDQAPDYYKLAPE